MNELLNNIIEGLARLGCGMVGLPYPPEQEEPTLGPFVATEKGVRAIELLRDSEPCIK